MKLTVCPFSLGVFFGSAFVVTQYQRRARSKKRLGESASLPPCKVVFVLGGPGAGKGTQCQLLVERLNGWAHLSTGDLLRAERMQGGPLGEEINSYIKQGKLVPSEVTCKLLEKGMTQVYQMTGSTKFLIDGFPRSFGNATAWQETMAVHHIEFVLNLGKCHTSPKTCRQIQKKFDSHCSIAIRPDTRPECPEEVLLGRLLERGQTSGRADDNIDVIRKRFNTNQTETAPVVERYEKEGKLRTVLSDKPVDDVYEDVVRLFQGI